MDERKLAEFAERARSLHARENLDDVARTVLDAFTQAGITALLLKGPVLARVLYRADEHRSYGDIDLLIAPGDLDGARRQLRAMGFVDASPTTVFGVDDVASLQHSDTWNRGGDGGPVLIDLHWRIPGCDLAPERAWKVLERSTSTIDLAGREVRVLDRAGLALHLALHAAQHGPGDQKALADLERGVERWPEEVWRSAALLAAELKGAKYFAAGIRLVPAGSALAGRLELPSSERETISILQREARPRGTFHVRAFKDASGVRAKGDVLRRSLFPPPAWIARSRPWAAGGRARLVAGYAAHILSAPMWALRAWRFSRRYR